MRAPCDPEAIQPVHGLLSRLYAQSGKVTMTGQHNQLYGMSKVSEEVERITGRYPLIWGGEWGFADERHDTDNIAYRPRLMEEVRRHHAMGCVIVMTYHQASPAVGEPCLFDPGVIGNLSDAEWDELLQEGTRLRSVWETEVDRLAEAFLTWQSEGIPIIFRPYHEMNGSWFWWGGDPTRFTALWKMLFARYQILGVHNLLWAWNPDKPWPGVEDYWPGDETVDLVGTDIYPGADREETYPQEWYERMKGIANGRPLALSENSAVPTPEELQRQPWSYWMGWDRLTLQANSEEALRIAFGSESCQSLIRQS